jgi:hypothetical protein
MKRHAVKICPRTGNVIPTERPRRWPALLLPITGLAALIWFLVRVVPKPSRAAYPCQRMAMPMASGFIVWLTGLAGSAILYRRARHWLDRSRYVLAAACAVAAVAVIWACIGMTEDNPAAAAFSPSEPVNSPMGTAKGIHPGRVVWVRDAKATRWDGNTGNWWDEGNTDQKVVDAMMSSTIRKLTGESTDAQAWEALFRHFNKTKGSGDTGYRKPEKIAIKLNMNQDRPRPWQPNAGMPSPQAVYALVHQLITNAGVPGSAITLYDATRYIGDPIYSKIRGNPDPEFQSVAFVVAPQHAGNGRVAAEHDTAHPLQTQAGTVYFPTCVTEAKYLINMALLRAHTLCGITLCAKNHFGSTYFTDKGWTPQPLHDTSSRKLAMGSYNCLVDLNGHKHMDGKTLLYMIDGIYPSKNQTAGVVRFASFGNDWFSSLLASQDMIALDSVGLDFLRAEQAANPVFTDVVGNPDNYLHEAAMAPRPTSGTKYDPEGDGTILASMGVHEHWNNPSERKYSRNLGIGKGIELMQQDLSGANAAAQMIGPSAVVQASSTR